MTDTTFTARFFNEDGGRSNQTVAPYKELLINTMKHLLLIFDDWDGFEIETEGKTIYTYLKNYGNKGTENTSAGCTTKKNRYVPRMRIRADIP